jgi:hypothetical protein
MGVIPLVVVGLMLLSWAIDTLIQPMLLSPGNLAAVGNVLRSTITPTPQQARDVFHLCSLLAAGACIATGVSVAVSLRSIAADMGRLSLRLYMLQHGLVAVHIVQLIALFVALWGLLIVTGSYAPGLLTLLSTILTTIAVLTTFPSVLYALQRFTGRRLVRDLSTVALQRLQHACRSSVGRSSTASSSAALDLSRTVRALGRVGSGACSNHTAASAVAALCTLGEEFAERSEQLTNRVWLAPPRRLWADGLAGAPAQTSAWPVLDMMLLVRGIVAAALARPDAAVCFLSWARAFVGMLTGRSRM